MSHPPFDYKLQQGEVKRITIEDINKAILLSQARFVAHEYFYYSNNTPDQLVKVLSELKYFDLAVDLALAFGLPAGYPVMLLMKEYYPTSEEQGIIPMVADDSETRHDGDFSSWKHCQLIGTGISLESQAA